MERGPVDQRDGSQRSDESTRWNAISIGVGAFVGVCIGGLLGAKLMGNIYLGIGIEATISALRGGVIGT